MKKKTQTVQLEQIIMNPVKKGKGGKSQYFGEEVEVLEKEKKNNNLS